MIELFNKTTFDCARLVTQSYSTSFTLGIKTLDKELHEPIYAIYGFVRYADEIVDTFHDWNRETLLDKFEHDTYEAIKQKISLNPILHAFQLVVNQYQIDLEFIDAFLNSMRMDLDKTTYCDKSYKTYIYGSAEVVGLMCLKVFCFHGEGDFDTLKPAACSLGSAFQKVNFLRDMKSDHEDRGRVYFPDINFDNFNQKDKDLIEMDIQKDFDDAYQGIIRLPENAKMGVYLAYIYYLKLFDKIKDASTDTVKNQRIRIPNPRKLALLAKTYLQFHLRVV
ncbi:phytoene/squalene synthase family protein [Persicobacter sp. CCB-QB2]|uniref:phytoene/squalene synthase family protein n=1 Tax=Persicobacter sp. CCB-QB2 TaxID=1561025 RepID=UPI0006A9764B|nr:phytoene/squalene synthase family protein [Persicobacter sp. CCB-QB2]